MIAEVKPGGMIMLESQSGAESNTLQQFVKSMAVDSAGFMKCCGRKQCAFEITLKDDS